MPKRKSSRIKLPIPVIIIAILLLLFAVQVLIIVFASVYAHFFTGYPIPQNASWLADIIQFFLISALVIFIAIALLKRKNYARILAIIALFVISILNLRAEIFIADSISIPSLIFNILFLLAALYLIFDKKVRRVFK